MQMRMIGPNKLFTLSRRHSTIIIRPTAWLEVRPKFVVIIYNSHFVYQTDHENAYNRLQIQTNAARRIEQWYVRPLGRDR